MIFWRPYLSISIWPVGNSSIFPPALFIGFLRHTYTCHSAPYHGTVVTQVIVLHASITYVTLLRLTNVFILCSYNCFLTVIGALTVSSFCSKASQSRVKYSLPPTPPPPPFTHNKYSILLAHYRRVYLLTVSSRPSQWWSPPIAISISAGSRYFSSHIYIELNKSYEISLGSYPHTGIYLRIRNKRTEDGDTAHRSLGAARSRQK